MAANEEAACEAGADEEVDNDDEPDDKPADKEADREVAANEEAGKDSDVDGVVVVEDDGDDKHDKDEAGEDKDDDGTASDDGDIDVDDDDDDEEFKPEEVTNVAKASGHRLIPVDTKQRRSSVLNLYANALDPRKYNLMHKAQQPVAADAPGFREAAEKIKIPAQMMILYQHCLQKPKDSFFISDKQPSQSTNVLLQKDQSTPTCCLAILPFQT